LVTNFPGGAAADSGESKPLLLLPVLPAKFAHKWQENQRDKQSD
jgi:hypothetical protein